MHRVSIGREVADTDTDTDTDTDRGGRGGRGRSRHGSREVARGRARSRERSRYDLPTLDPYVGRFGAFGKGQAGATYRWRSYRERRSPASST